MANPETEGEPRDRPGMPPASMHGHDFAECRYTALIECLHGYVVIDTNTERAHTEARPAILHPRLGENLVGRTQTIRPDPPAQVVPHRARHAPPADRHHALIVSADRLDVGRRTRCGAARVAEHAQIADRQVL